MDASTVLRLLTDTGRGSGEEDRRLVTQMFAATTSDEQAGIMTTLRRGGDLNDAAAWLDRARRAARSMDPHAYRVALAMYGDSTLLEWNECLDIAPALTYRASLPDGVPA